MTRLLGLGPVRLREVSGIGEMRATRIAAAWAEQKAVRDIMVFLHSNGVGTSRAVRIFKTYGHDAIQVMTENPYRLARDIRGIGFPTADAIGMRLGLTKESPQRLRAGVSFALQEATDDGHCGFPKNELIRLAADHLDVPSGSIETALAEELTAGGVVADTIEETECIFLRGLHTAERGVADRLLSLRGGATPSPDIDASVAVAWVEKKTGRTLAASQREAVAMALKSKVVVVTGGPGVGKTTLLDAILKILRAKSTEILLAAPPSARPSRPAWRPRPSIACSKPIASKAASSAAPTIHSTATFWSSARRA